MSQVYWNLDENYLFHALNSLFDAKLDGLIDHLSIINRYSV